MKIEQLSHHFGLLIRPDGQATLDSIQGDRIFELLASGQGGLILLRGFDANIDSFRQFTDRLGAGFLVHHNTENRDFVADDKTFATVNKDNHPIDFHIEMAANPIKPDVLWLHCVAPALRRGRIGFADGHLVLRNLTQRTRDKIQSQGFRYHYSNLPPSTWRPVWEAVVGKLCADKDGLLKQLEQFGAQLDVTAITLNDLDELSFDYCCQPIYTAPVSGLPVFASGLLDNPVNTLMGDGSAVRRSILVEITQASYQDAVWIDWQPGDVVIADNTRVMHAREAFEDSQRHVLIRYSRGLPRRADNAPGTALAA